MKHTFSNIFDKCCIVSPIASLFKCCIVSPTATVFKGCIVSHSGTLHRMLLIYEFKIQVAYCKHFTSVVYF